MNKKESADVKKSNIRNKEKKKKKGIKK